jgi:hypothetical protein
VVTRCTNEDEFIATFRRLVDETTVFVVMRDPKPTSPPRRFSIQLANGTPMLEGEGRILESWPAAPGLKRPGMRIELAKLDEASQAMHKRLLAKPPAAPPPTPPTPPPVPRDAAARPVDDRSAAPGDGIDEPTQVTDRPEATPPPPAGVAEPQRVPGSAYTLPANPFMELSPEALEYFVECTLYEDSGVFSPVDQIAPAMNEPPPEPPAATPAPGILPRAATPLPFPAGVPTVAGTPPPGTGPVPAPPLLPPLSPVLAALAPPGAAAAGPAADPLPPTPPVGLPPAPPPPAASEPLAPIVPTAAPAAFAADPAAAPLPLPSPPPSGLVAMPSMPMPRDATGEVPLMAPRMPIWPVVLVAVLTGAIGLIGGYLLWGRKVGTPVAAPAPAVTPPSTATPPPAPTPTPEPAPVEDPAGKESPEATEDPAAAAGGDGCRIELRTTAGADVLLGGKRIGQTPLEKDVPCGQTTLAIVHPRYERVERALDLAAGKPFVYEAPLSRPDAVLDLVSTPPGAQFTVNGAPAGSQARVQGYTFVTVTASLAGHKPWSQKVYVKGTRMRVSAKLQAEKPVKPKPKAPSPTKPAPATGPGGAALTPR